MKRLTFMNMRKCRCGIRPTTRMVLIDGHGGDPDARAVYIECENLDCNSPKVIKHSVIGDGTFGSTDPEAIHEAVDEWNTLMKHGDFSEYDCGTHVHKSRVIMTKMIV